MRTTLITLIAVALLSNAVTAGAANLDKKEPPPPGRVLMRVVTNTTRLGLLFSKFDKTRIKSLEPKGKTYVLYPYGAMEAGPIYHAPLPETIELSQALPPGKYRLQSLFAGSADEYSPGVTTTLKVRDDFPTFEIVQDQVTDLGVLIVQPVGRGNAVLIPAADFGNAHVHLLRSGAIEESWLSKPVIDWRPQDSSASQFEFGTPEGAIDSDARLSAQRRWDEAKTRGALLALAKTATVALSQPAVAADGTMYFGSQLGQVLHRSKDGVWTPMDTGTLALVTAVALADTDLYAGLEDGRILQMKDGAWVVAGQAPGAAHVTTLAKLSSGEWWLVTQAWTGKQTVMNADSSKSLTGIAETPTKTLVQPGPDFWSGVKAPVTAFAGTSRGFLLRPEFESLVYDASTATWGGPRLKKDAPSFRANNDGTVLFSMRPGRLSVDGGASWSAFEPRGTLVGLAFFNAPTGLGLFGTDQLTLFGTQELRSTTDGGKTWTFLNELKQSPCNVYSLRQNDVAQRLICVFHDGSIHSAGMTGEWTVERVVY